MKLYKILGADGKPCNGGKGKWFLPHGKRAGKWMPPIKGNLKPCQNGYHLCRRGKVVLWLNARIFEAESKGDRAVQYDDIVVRQARLIRELTTWNERTARLFACDCAERALSRVDKPDERSIAAAAVARRFAAGGADADELYSARIAAGCSAWHSARDGARYSARCSPWYAERKWQTRRLFEYLDGKRG